MKNAAHRHSASETILVAEDDPIFRRLLQSRLESWGYRVTTVEDGAQAWELLRQPTAPDLIILDWLMPGVDGIELCRRILRNGSETAIHIFCCFRAKTRDTMSSKDWKREPTTT